MQLGFGQMLRFMMFIRNFSAEKLAKKAYLPREAVSMVANGLFVATPELEHKLRVMLDWPKSSDDLISMIYSCKYADETPAPKPEPVAVTAPIVMPSQLLQQAHKKLGRPRKVRPEDNKIEDDGEVIDLGELRGAVVG